MAMTFDSSVYKMFMFLKPSTWNTQKHQSFSSSTSKVFEKLEQISKGKTVIVYNLIQKHVPMAVDRADCEIGSFN